MGHIRLGRLPKTRKWNEIVDLIHYGAGAGQIANAVLRAAEKNLRFAGRDQGVVEGVWLLMQLPLAARSDDFAGALRELGLDVGDAPGLFEIIAAVGERIDASMPATRGRTDVGEIAQMAVAETLSEFVGSRVDNLFGVGPEDVRHHFGTLATIKNFGLFAKDFYARFAEKTLDYLLSKTLPDHVGEGRRFATLADQGAFSDALHTHCREVAKIVQAYSGEFLSKHRFELDGSIDRKTASDYASYGFKKMVDGLTQGEALVHA